MIYISLFEENSEAYNVTIEKLNSLRQDGLKFQIQYLQKEGWSSELINSTYNLGRFVVSSTDTTGFAAFKLMIDPQDWNTYDGITDINGTILF